MQFVCLVFKTSFGCHTSAKHAMSKQRPNAVDVGEARAHARARTARSNATSRIGGCAELGGQDHHLRWRIVGHVQPGPGAAQKEYV